MYAYWPDDTYCEIEDLEEYLTFKSDDFETISQETLDQRLAQLDRH